MMATQIEPDIVPPPTRIGQPAWAIATLYPMQGQWSEEAYFRLEAERFVELVDGCIEVLPMPTWLHGVIVLWFAERLNDWNKQAKIGDVLVAPVPMKLFAKTIREPDALLVKRPPGTPRSKYPAAAHLVMEVISDGQEARNRDLVEKRADYAKAGIPEYWVIDPLEKAVIVFRLDGGEYVVHGRFDANQTATSAALAGFSVDCTQIWALEQQ
jgi:Uma2 family endonuclease